MIQISEETLQSARTLRAKQQEIQMELGALYLSEKEIAARQEALVAELQASGEEIKSIMKGLAEEHGHGTLNLETGEFAVSEQETTPELKVVK